MKCKSNHNKMHFTLTRIAIINITSFGEDVESLKPSYFVSGNKKWSSDCENSLWISQYIKPRIAI